MLMILDLKICGFIIWYLNTKMISIIVNMLFKYSLKLEKKSKIQNLSLLFVLIIGDFSFGFKGTLFQS